MNAASIEKTTINAKKIISQNNLLLTLISQSFCKKIEFPRPDSSRASYFATINSRVLDLKSGLGYIPLIFSTTVKYEKPSYGSACPFLHFLPKQII
jgi:hypothetical protein